MVLGSSGTASGGIRFKNLFDFIADAAEDFELFFLVPFGVRRVVEAPVMSIELAGKHRAGLVGIAANGDDGFDLLFQKFVHVLGAMFRDVDANLGHHANGERMDVAGGFASGALHIEDVPGSRAQDSLGQMAAAGIAGAKDENGGFVVRHGFNNSARLW